MRLHGQSYAQLVPDWGARRVFLTVSHFPSRLTTKSRFTLRLQNFSIKKKTKQKHCYTKIMFIIPNLNSENIIYASSEPK
jgi:hypothetical protein